MSSPHHAEGRVDPVDLALKNRNLFLDTPEHVESENIHLKIGHGLGGFSTNFFQKLIQIHKMWLKLPKIGNN
jgi:hypothetical protein